jgi:hypothetical protein
MGCDIHIFAERFDNKSKKWIAVKKKDEWAYNHYNNCFKELLLDEKNHIKSIFNGHKADLENQVKRSENSINWLPSDRNYLGFGFIADVRNDGKRIKPFKIGGNEEPKDFDLSPDLLSELKDWDPDYHSFVTYTEKELENAIKNLNSQYKNSKISSEDFQYTMAFIEANFLVPLKYMKELYNEKIRFVMFFDN